MDKTRLLIIDDDVQLLDLLSVHLEEHGYGVITATEARQGLRRFYEDRPDMVILDAMMPGMDGWSMCERIRDMADVPIIVLTALREDDAKLRGLLLSVDDYVVKPVEPPELTARVESVLRQTQPRERLSHSEALYADGYLVIDADRVEVHCDGKPIHLTATEFQLLLFLVRNRGRLLSGRQILTNVWGFEDSECTNYARLYVWRLRQKIEPDPARPRYILTEHGMGYRFVGRR